MKYSIGTCDKCAKKDVILRKLSRKLCEECFNGVSLELEEFKNANEEEYQQILKQYNQKFNIIDKKRAVNKFYKIKKRHLSKCVRRHFIFNDGLDGIVLARSEKQAISILCRELGHSKKEIVQWQKNFRKNENYTSKWCNWNIEKIRSGTKGKSRIIGFLE